MNTNKKIKNLLSKNLIIKSPDQTVVSSELRKLGINNISYRIKPSSYYINKEIKRIIVG